MRDPLQRLYQTKLALLATIFAFAGVIVLTVSAWSDATGSLPWLATAPAVELGSALFITGLVVIAFEYVDGRDSERRAEERLKRLLATQGPAMRDAVIAGFAVERDDLARVSSPDTLDRIIDNSLAIRLGDREMAASIYRDLRQHVVRSRERWYDVDITIGLSPWEGKGTRAGTPMFVATVRWEYKVIPTSPVRRFACVSDHDEYRDLADDPASTRVWYFSPVEGIDASSKEAFQLLRLSVDGTDRPIRRSTKAGSQTYTVNLGKKAAEAAEPVTVSYTYRTLVEQYGHLLRIDLDQPSKDVTIELRHGNCGIRHVNVLDYITSAEPARIARSPEAVPAPSVSVSFDDWTFPRSGVAFVWALENEIQRRRDSHKTSRTRAKRS